MQTMNQALMLKPETLSIQDVVRPEAEDDGLIVRVESVSINGDDIKTFKNGNSNINFPRILGSEIAGSVVEKCSRLTDCDFNVGDRVVLGQPIPCGKCYECESGHAERCTDLKVLGKDYNGGWAQYVKVTSSMLNSKNIKKIKYNYKSDYACLQSQFAKQLNAVESQKIKIGDKIAIFGCGPMGIMIGLWCQRLAASKVMLFDPDISRVNLARQFDFTCVDAVSAAYQQVMYMTENRGADVIFTANNDVDSWNTASNYAQPGARICFCDQLSSAASQLTLSSTDITQKEIQIIGARSFSPEQLNTSLRYLETEAMPVSKLITQTYELKDIKTAIRMIENRKVIKVVIKPNGDLN